MRHFRTWGLVASLFVAAGCSNPEPETPPQDEKQATPGQEKADPIADAFALEIRHVTGVRCEARDAGGSCVAKEHWLIARELDPAKLDPILKREADRERAQGNPRVSERRVVICAEPGTSWGVIQETMHKCAQAGIYKIDWRASLSNPEAEITEVWLPKDVGIFGDPVPNPILEEIRVFMKSDRETRELTRKVNARVMGSDDELVAALRERVEKFRSIGKTDVPIIIDSDPEVRWADVVHATKLCRKADPVRVEFAAPMPAGWKGGGKLDLERPRDVFERKGLPKVKDEPADDEPAIFFPDEEERDDKETPADEKEKGEGDLGLGGGGGGGRFGIRLGGRRNLVARGGGSQGPGGTEAAVTAGLRWLARHQSADGSWSAEGFDTHCADAKCPGQGYKEYDAGETGLALLAFLGAGYTHLTKETYVDPHSNKTVCWGVVVKQAIKWLMTNQDADGCFGGRLYSKYMYNHAIAAMAMAEAYGLTNSALFKDSAQKGIDFLLQAQNPNNGWRYSKACGDNDTSVTAWCLMALKAAEFSGLKRAEAGYPGAKAWILAVTDPVTFKAGYTAMGTGKVVVVGKNEDWDGHEALTAVGMTCRIFIDHDKLDPALEAGAKMLVADLPSFSDKKIDYYYWYHGSLAVFQYDGPDGKYWKSWNEAMKDALVPAQKSKKDGCTDGSWDSDVDRWGFEGGRVYATAINVLTLETYYRYANVFGRK